MRICKQCQAPMEEGYRIRVSTYGIMKLEQGTVKRDEVSVALCPSCGEVSFFIRKENADQ